VLESSFYSLTLIGWNIFFNGWITYGNAFTDFLASLPVHHQLHKKKLQVDLTRQLEESRFLVGKPEATWDTDRQGIRQSVLMIWNAQRTDETKTQC